MTVGQTAVLSAGMIALSSDQSGKWDISLMDIGHGLMHALTHDRADDYGPAWSPARGQLAFYSDRSGDGRTEIYVMNLDGSGLQLMTDGLSNVWRPDWSPDGQRLVFIQNFGNIEIMNGNWANRRGLIYGFGPAWSPLSSRIAYYANRAGDLNGDIFVIDADGRNARNLSQHPANDWDPAWSPDGRQIAFVSSRDGSAELFVMDAECPSLCGTNVRRLTFNHVLARTPAWSPDARQILFESEINGTPQVYLVQADGSNLRRLTAGRSPIWINLLDR